MMKSPRLLFVAATRMEVQAFLERFDCREASGPGWCLIQPDDGGTGDGPDDGSWACLVTGVGVFNTASGLSACLSGCLGCDLKGGLPDLVVDVGIAGAFPGAGLEIGSLALAESETYLHTGVGGDKPLPFDLIPGEARTRKGVYPMDSKALEFCRGALESAGLGPVAQGAFLTVSTITDSIEKAEVMRAAAPYLMENMEGAAAAHICKLYNVPMAELRAVSNITGERDKTRWNIPAACRSIAKACLGLASASS